MNAPNRTIRVWVILVAAMTLTTGLLGMLRPEKGSSTQFSLSSYYVNSSYSLDVLRISSSAVPFSWRGVSVETSGTEAGNISTLAMAKGLTSKDLLNYHFVIRNGEDGISEDGFIEPTTRWKEQFPCTEEGGWLFPGYVRICLIGKDSITEKQMQSLEDLVEGIRHNCDIPAEKVQYDF